VGLRDGGISWPECDVRVELTQPSAVLVNLFLRAFVMVTLVAANTRQISQGHYGWALVCGCLISYVWYRNVGKASRDERQIAAIAYALGAGCGTVCGMWLAG
jgi:4-amino-4-deoxy-L-arabinose transferase-like glycosyltransferase